MATGRRAFVNSVGSEPVTPIPEFPKLPECLKRGKSADDLKQIEEYESKVDEFHKKERQRGL